MSSKGQKCDLTGPSAAGASRGEPTHDNRRISDVPSGSLYFDLRPSLGFQPVFKLGTVG